MEFAHRLAHPAIAAQYPLEVTGTAQWQPGADGQTWSTHLTLPPIPKDHIIVPSYASLEQPYGDHFQFGLSCENAESNTAISQLDEVPSPAQTTDQAEAEDKGAKTEAMVSSHIDCWHTNEAIEKADVELVVHSAEQPQAYLIAISIRPLTVAEDRLPSSSYQATKSITIERLASISQLQSPADIRHRICSPTALAMRLSSLEQAPGLEATVKACFDPRTRAYGSWPRAIRWAAQNDVIGAIETITDWSRAEDLLSQGYSLICSIRFDKNKLTNAPLKSTPGHLVLLYGIDSEYALVKDPAGANHDEVERRYRIDEFARAWLHRRGAYYLLSKTAWNGKTL